MWMPFAIGTLKFDVDRIHNALKSKSGMDTLPLRVLGQTLKLCCRATVSGGQSEMSIPKLFVLF